jgi:16S rRNA (uracil1498-N3)-methyltransferase
VAHFYLTPHGTRLISGETVVLSGDEARHAAKAARLRVGEKVALGDGRGTIAQAEAVNVSADEVALVVLSAQTTAASEPALWLVQSLAKSGRDEQAIEQATEVGVSDIIPLAASRSVVSWEGKKRETGVSRWQRIVTEATKQSIQPHVPTVHDLHSVEQLAHRCSDASVLVLDYRAEQSLFDASLDTSRPVAVVVGPEGGLSETEIDTLVAARAIRVKLGPGVLRTSSAGPVALSLLHQKLGHW